MRAGRSCWATSTSARSTPTLTGCRRRGPPATNPATFLRLASTNSKWSSIACSSPRDQVKSCRDADGTLFAERIGVDYRACKTWLDAIHSIAKDLAVWEQADIKYNGQRHDDDAQEDDVDEDVMEDGEDDLDDDEL